MANTVLLKRNSTPGAIPSIGSLQLGELAINTRDGQLFLKRNDGSGDTIVKVWTSAQHGSGSGLDADLLDGQHGSYYQPTSTAITTSNVQSQSVLSATKLTTPRTINGVPFDGTANIVIESGPTAVSQNYTATGGQTVFTVTGGYIPNILSVYRNGVKLVNGSDVDVQTGTSFTLTVGAVVGDSIEVSGFQQSVAVIQNMLDDAIALQIALG